MSRAGRAGGSRVVAIRLLTINDQNMVCGHPANGEQRASLEMPYPIAAAATGENVPVEGEESVVGIAVEPVS